MKCLRTGANMKEVEINKVKVDICECCGGVWFDNLEFEKFDEAQESAGDELVDLLGILRLKFQQIFRKGLIARAVQIPC